MAPEYWLWQPRLFRRRRSDVHNMRSMLCWMPSALTQTHLLTNWGVTRIRQTDTGEDRKRKLGQICSKRYRKSTKFVGAPHCTRDSGRTRTEGLGGVSHRCVARSCCALHAAGSKAAGPQMHLESASLPSTEPIRWLTEFWCGAHLRAGGRRLEGLVFQLSPTSLSVSWKSAQPSFVVQQ